MAKRKKLNKNVVIVLVLVGGVVLMAGGYLGYRKGLHHKIFKKDPDACARLARADLAKGKYDDADENFKDTMKWLYLSGRTEPAAAAYYYEYARFLLEWVQKKGSEMNEAQRREHSGVAINCLRTALLRDPNHVDSQRALTDISWEIARAGNKWVVFINEADRLLTLVPNDHKTFFLRARAWDEMAKAVPGQNSENAIRDYKKALELKNDEPEYWRNYAEFLQQEGRLEEADKTFNEAIKILPNNPELRVTYSSFLQSRNRRQEAVDQVQEAIRLAPNSPVGYLAMAQIHLTDGKSDLALQVLETARKIDENDYRVHAALAQTYRIRKQPDKAMETLRDGLAAIDRKIKETAASGPSGEGSTAMEANRRILSYYLADMLLDGIMTDPNNQEAYLKEAKGISEQTVWSSGEAARRAKIAGRIAYLEGDLPTATKFLEEAYQSFGASDPVVTDYLIRIYLRQDLPGKAEKLLDQLRRNPAFANDPRALLLKAQLEMQYRNFEQASRYVDQVLKADPNSTDALNMRKTLQAATGQLSTEQLMANMDASKPSISALVNRAVSMWMEEDKDAAVRMLEAVHAKVPDNEAVVQRLLWMYAGQNDLAKAKRLIDQAKTAFPQKAAEWNLQEKFLAETDPNKRLEIALSAADETSDPFQKAMDKAGIATMFRNQEAYVSYVEEAAKINPDHPMVVERVFKIALARKDWPRAEDAAKRAGALNLDSAEGRVFRAQLAIAQEQYAQAIPLLQEALRLRPDDKYPAILLGDCFLRTKELIKAREAVETVANNDPTYVPALIRMAMITEQQGKMSEHAEWITRANRLAPTDSYVRKQYLQMLEERNDPTDVIAQREKLFQRDPTDMENCARLAALYERTKQNDKAEAFYQAVYQRSTNRMVTAGLLADFYMRNGRRADADRILVDLLQTWPDKIAAYLMYGEFLSRYSVDQASVAVEKAIAIDPNDARGYIILARLKVQTKDTKGAADSFARYVALRPTDLAAKKEMLRYFIDSGRTAEAQQQLEAMLAANPSDAETMTILGILWLRQSDMVKALSLMDRAIAANPNSPDPLTTRATIYMIQGKATEAKLDLENARKLSDSPTIAVNLAGIHARLGDPTRAQGILRELLDKPATADYGPAMYMLADLYFQQQRWQLLTPLLERAKSKYPGDAHYRQLEAQMYVAMGDAAKAVAAMEKAVAEVPDSTDILRECLQALLDNGQYAKVLSMSQARLDKVAAESWLLAIRGEALARSGDVAKADEAFQAAANGGNTQQLGYVVQKMMKAYGPQRTLEKFSAWVASRPKDRQIYMLMGMLYGNQQQGAKAVEMFLKAVEMAADDNSKGDAWRELGLSYYQLKDFPKAEEAYLAALKVAPEDIAVMNNLAYMYANDLNQPEKALPHAEKAASLAPQNPDILDTYGWALAKSSHNNDAERFLLRAIQNSETAAQAALPRYHLGYVYEQTARFAEAIRQYRQGLEAMNGKNGDPLNADLTESIKRVQQKQAQGPATRSAS